MPEPIHDVLTIGNAIVDVLAHTEEDFLVSEGLVKGSMRLIDGAEADRASGQMGPARRPARPLGGVLAHTEGCFLVRGGRARGSMRLIDGAEADRLYGHMCPAQL